MDIIRLAQIEVRRTKSSTKICVFVENPPDGTRKRKNDYYLTDMANPRRLHHLNAPKERILTYAIDGFQIPAQNGQGQSGELSLVACSTNFNVSQIKSRTIRKPGKIKS